MKEDWKNIKKQIEKAEAPLSADAWNNMEKMLGRPKGISRWWIPLSMAVAILLGWLFFAPAGLQDAEKRGIEIGNSKSEDLHLPDLQMENPKSKEGNKADERENFPVAGSEEQKSSGAETSEGDAADPEYPSRESGNSESLANEQKTVVKEPTFANSNMEEEIGGNEQQISLAPKEFADIEVKEQASDPLIADATMQESLRINRKKPSQSGRLELRLYAGPAYTFTGGREHDGENAHKDLEAAREDAVKPGVGFDAGAELRFRVFSHFRVSSGIGLRQMVTNNNYDFTVDEVPVIDSVTNEIIGYLSVDPQRRQNSNKNTFTYLTIPVSVYYQWPLADRWNITAEAIHNFSFLIKQESTTLNGQWLEMEEMADKAFSKHQNSYQIRLGLQYEINQNLYIALEPGYRSFYKNIYGSGPDSWKPSDLSLNISAIIKLNSNP